MFATHTLSDAVALVRLTSHTPQIDASAHDLCKFTFPNLDEAEACALLRSPAAEVMRAFHKEWRNLRRRMQAATEAARAGQ
jgi:hypothetical protein